jgi:hypothetical protein
MVVIMGSFVAVASRFATLDSVHVVDPAESMSSPRVVPGVTAELNAREQGCQPGFVRETSDPIHVAAGASALCLIV